MDNSRIKMFGTYLNDCVEFHENSMINTNMEDSDFGHCTVYFENCDTTGAKFKRCKIGKLNSSFIFRMEYLMKGGEIRHSNFIEKYISHIGQTYVV
jgi:hypothetical protein